MLKKRLLSISLLLPLVAMSVTAHAGSTITDKSYCPTEPRQSMQARTGGLQSDVNSALASDRSASRPRPATVPNESGSAWRYHGGPKSR
jgi:hypothetical protein